MENFNNLPQSPIVVDTDSDTAEIYNVIDRRPHDDVLFVGEERAPPKNKSLFPTITNTEQCPICMEKVSRVSVVCPCHHIYCLSCIAYWFQEKDTCPICRHRVKSIIYDFRSPIDYSEIIVNKISQDRLPLALDQEIIENVNPVNQLPLPNGHLLVICGSAPTEPPQHGVNHRRAIYTRNLNRFFRTRNMNRMCRQRTVNVVSKWIKRDLRAILPYDANITEIMNSMTTCLLGRGRININLQSLQSITFYQLCVRYLGNYASKFISELVGFFGSGFSMERYDFSVDYY